MSQFCALRRLGRIGESPNCVRKRGHLRYVEVEAVRFVISEFRDAAEEEYSELPASLQTIGQKLAKIFAKLKCYTSNHSHRRFKASFYPTF